MQLCNFDIKKFYVSEEGDIYEIIDIVKFTNYPITCKNITTNEITFRTSEGKMHINRNSHSNDLVREATGHEVLKAFLERSKTYEEIS